MLYYLAAFKDGLGILRLFEYITFRAAGAALMAFLLVVLLGSFTVRMLRTLNAQAADRYAGVLPPEMIDAEKTRTPCMGGILLVGGILLASLFFMNLANPISLVLILSTLGFSFVGFCDDFMKVVKKRRDGISARIKFLSLVAVALAAVGALGLLPETRDIIQCFYVPFLKEPLPYVSNFYFTVPFATLVIVGASNAVNLTDGKDGLSSGCTIFCMVTYAAFAYIMGHRVFAGYLNVPYIPGVGEAVVFAAAMIGGCLGFLWHNCKPAAMFMGDTGSLALGGAIGLFAVLARQEILLALVGGIFVMEAGSVIIQVASFRLTGKRVFLCTPIHHHFERKGWGETQIVVRFWILAIIFALAGLATLKLR